MMNMLLVATLVFGILGCDEPTAPPTRDGVVTDVTVFPPIVQKGQTAKIKVTLTNYTSEVVTVNVSGCLFNVEVGPENGEPFDSFWPCPLGLFNLDVNPGETLVEIRPISPEPWWLALPDGQEILPAGRYKIRAGLEKPDGISPWDEATLSVIW